MSLPVAPRFYKWYKIEHNIATLKKRKRIKSNRRTTVRRNINYKNLRKSKKWCKKKSALLVTRKPNEKNDLNTVKR